MKIRITSMPPGEAPEEIRKQWIGLVLEGEPYSPRSGYSVRGTYSAKPVKNAAGFLIPVGKAIEALRAEHPEAALWWDGWYEEMVGLMDEFVFASGCYEVVE